jgi:hypothetical protein
MINYLSGRHLSHYPVIDSLVCVTFSPVLTKFSEHSRMRSLVGASESSHVRSILESDLHILPVDVDTRVGLSKSVNEFVDIFDSVTAVGFSECVDCLLLTHDVRMLYLWISWIRIRGPFTSSVSIIERVPPCGDRGARPLRR